MLPIEALLRLVVLVLRRWCRCRCALDGVMLLVVLLLLAHLAVLFFQCADSAVGGHPGCAEAAGMTTAAAVPRHTMCGTSAP